MTSGFEFTSTVLTLCQTQSVQPMVLLLYRSGLPPTQRYQFCTIAMLGGGVFVFQGMVNSRSIPHLQAPHLDFLFL